MSSEVKPQPVQSAPPPIKKVPSPIQHTLDQIDILIRARYPILYLLTHEEARLENLVEDIARRQGKQLFIWSGTEGLIKHLEAGGTRVAVRSATPEMTDPNDVLRHIATQNTGGLFLLKDFHPFLEDPLIIRRLRDVAQKLKGTYKSLLLSSPRLNLPIELEKEITLIDIPLPDLSELSDLLKSLCQVVGTKDRQALQITQRDFHDLARAALGLTLTEAENAFSKAVVSDSKLTRNDIQIVLAEKQQIIRKSGILDFHQSDATLGEVGGLHNLKQWLKIRGKAFQQGAEEFGLPSPKGVLLLGAPGCGKSLMAKAVAQAWQLPLLRLDFGRIFSGLVGSSEENMRRALKVAEGIAPAVLWIDELEKGLAGGTSGQGDSGVSARVFGTFLSWMQEKSSTVFVVATANRIDMLPPELMRRGRFDEIFFLDLPRPAVREEIVRIHLAKKKRGNANVDLKPLIAATEGFSGAELEHCVMEGLFLAFDAGRDLTVADLVLAAQKTVPLSVTYVEELRRSREWASKRARSADEEDAPAQGGNRASRLEVK